MRSGTSVTTLHRVMQRCVTLKIDWVLVVRLFNVIVFHDQPTDLKVTFFGGQMKRRGLINYRMTQLRSLTQFYSVSFLQSWICVKKCVFLQTQDQGLCISEVLEGMHVVKLRCLEVRRVSSNSPLRV